jgi:hypothetical protein
MSRARRLARGLAALGAAVLAASRPTAAGAQGDSAATRPAPGEQGRPARPAPTIFDTEEPLAVTLTADLGQLRRDRGDEPPWRDATLAYAAPDGRQVTVPLRTRARGFWRRRHCGLPPLRLDFAGKAVRGTAFAGLDKPKLVNYCHDDDTGEQYVLQELMLYRVFAVLAPVAHRTRLLRTTYVDAATARPLTTRYAILLEEPKALAARVGGQVVAVQGAKQDDFDAFNAAVVGLFQYMIGNADWSASQLHNAEIVRGADLDFVLVPYDFDFSGAVNARYATPDRRLGTKTVRERVYRGHCASPAALARALAHFRERREAIHALYADPVGALLRPAVVRETLVYFDAFYRTIERPAMVQEEIVSACRRLQ